MTAGTALLAAILADPACDTARLVYADWFEENGQPELAEFIRVQIELHLFKVSPFVILATDERAPKIRRLKAREAKLLDDHGREWCCFGSLKFGNLDGSFREMFSRGFISSLSCTAADWLQYADAITAQQPIERVTLTTWPDWADNKHRQRFISPVVLQNLKILWPSIKFELPPEPARSGLISRRYRNTGEYGRPNWVPAEATPDA